MTQKDYLSELQKEQLEDKRISKLRDLKNNIKQKLEEIVRE